VGHFGKGVDHLEYPLPIVLGNAHRREDEGAAHPLDLKHRSKAGQHAGIKHRLQTFEEVLLADPERSCDFGVGQLADREVALQAVDDRAIDGVDGHTVTHSVLHPA